MKSKQHCFYKETYKCDPGLLANKFQLFPFCWQKLTTGEYPICLKYLWNLLWEFVPSSELKDCIIRESMSKDREM